MIFPFKIIQITPKIDSKIPKNWKNDGLVFSINQEKKIINNGAIDPIIDALITIVEVNAMYVNELKIVTPKIDNIMNGIYFIKIKFDNRVESHRIIKSS